MITYSAQQTNPYLTGNFAPWPSEHEVADLRVIGQLPPELRGTYLRNGPNPAFPPRHRYHWFDGDGMVHAVMLCDGVASYRNRFVETEGLRLERRAGRALSGGLLEPRSELAEAAPIKNAANTNVVLHAGRLLTLFELGLPTEIDAHTLATHGLYDFGGALRTPMTAHPKIDPETGELLFFGYSPAPPYLTYHTADRSGRLVRSEEVAVEWPSVLHDFAVTPEHVIFILCPLVLSLDAMSAGATPVSWQPERGTRIGVMPRHGTNADVRWFSTDACFVFHVVNAYQECERLVLDVVRWDHLGQLSESESVPGTRPVSRTLHRWILDLRGGTVGSEAFVGAGVEFPRIDERRLGAHHRYAYVAANPEGVDASPDSFRAIYKYDLTAGGYDRHDFEPSQACGEPLFVPRGSTTAEDDGYLMTFVYDGRRDTSEFVILDARDVRREPIARVEMPHRIPFGFHGTWVPAQRG